MNYSATSPAGEQAMLGASDFRMIRDKVYQYCGVDLEGKEILVQSRLSKKLRQLNLSSFKEYCRLVESDVSQQSFTEMIDALTTNHTSFFREPRHFAFLRETILPSIAPGNGLKVWSAACSTGEEPYSIAFTLLEEMGEVALSRASITATDISTRVLKRAASGIFAATAMKDVPQTTLKRWCLRGVGDHAAECLVKPEVRRMIDFQQLNLLHDCSSVGPFHVIFCRNVLIYFDRETQQQVIDNLTSRLLPGGYLLIGHAESLSGINHSLETICSATFRKAGGGTVRRETRREFAGIGGRGGCNTR
jgi:chemotaxis protein methyltransferase CheR